MSTKRLLIALWTLGAAAMFAGSIFTVNLVITTLILPDSLPGEVIIPYSGPTEPFIARDIATRVSDNLAAYPYKRTNGGLPYLAFVDTNRNIHTVQMPNAGQVLGMECDWQGNTLYYCMSEPNKFWVYELGVSFAWPPVLTTNAVLEWTATSSRWPDIKALENGTVLATSYRAGNDGLRCFTFFRETDGDWVTNILDVSGEGEYSNQTAGNTRIVQHPASKLVYIFGLLDATSADFYAAVMSASPTALTLVSNMSVSDGFPENGITSEYAFEGELVYYFRVKPKGTNILISGQAGKYFYILPVSPFYKVCPIVNYELAAHNIKSPALFSSNWTERFATDHVFVSNKLFIVSLPTNMPNASVQGVNEFMQILSAESTNQVGPMARIGYWSSIGQGSNALAYVRRYPDVSGQGHGVINRLP